MPGSRSAWWFLTIGIVALGAFFGVIAVVLTVQGDLGRSLFFWILAAIGVAVAAWVVSINRRRKERAAAVMPAWHEVMSQWNPLNYCHRCDVVFAPGSSRFETPEEMSQRLAVWPG